ncbi:MAG: hypothetical protein AAF328_08235 [Planctomycetota bacterium]
MAKMFYTLDEAAEKLGVQPDAIKEMAAEGKLQQFRDRDKLMFKRDQVDGLAASAGSSGAIPIASDSASGMSATGSSMILLDDSGDTKIDDALEDEDPREASGVSVFDAGEIEPADPMAQTQVTSARVDDDEELALESVGSGSGLLDLTRESDDTSLGAELLDEIYPGGGDESSADFKMESSVGSSGVFDGAMSMETGASGPSGLEHLGGSISGASDGSAVFEAPSAGVGGATVAAGTAAYASDEFDPAGSGLSFGLLFVAFIALAIGLIVTTAAVLGERSQLTSLLIDERGNSSVMFLTIGLLVGAVLFGVIGLMVGKKNT